MGFRHAAVLSATSFFLGVLFISFNVDRRILYGGVRPSEEDYADAFKFYTTFFEAPLAIKALLHAVMGIGLLALAGKLHKWDDSAVFFDGTSLALFLAGVIIYISVTIPTMRTVVDPLPGDSIGDQRDAIAVLAAGNTLIAGCLVGVLGLQAGQEYARRSELREQQNMQKKEAAAASEKKQQ